MTKKKKIWDKGLKIYKNFASKFGLGYAIPKTDTLELFALLKDKGEKELLLREMMYEFLDNFCYEKIILRNGNIFRVDEKLTKL